MAEQVLIQVGTLDDPAVFERPAAAIFTVDQPFHLVADGVPTYFGRVVPSSS